MAIIFLNNKNAENKWHLIIAGIAVVAMLAIALLAFYPSPAINPAGNSAAQKVMLNFAITDSDFIKNLQPFPAVSLQGIQEGRSEPFLIYYQPSVPVKK